MDGLKGKQPGKLHIYWGKAMGSDFPEKNQFHCLKWLLFVGILMDFSEIYADINSSNMWRFHSHGGTPIFMDGNPKMDDDWG